MNRMPVQTVLVSPVTGLLEEHAQEEEEEEEEEGVQPVQEEKVFIFLSQ